MRSSRRRRPLAPKKSIGRPVWGGASRVGQTLASVYGTKVLEGSHQCRRGAHRFHHFFGLPASSLKQCDSTRPGGPVTIPHLTVKTALVLCVSPPLAGAPLPYTPVSVRVYVPGLLLVCTVRLLLALLDPVSETELGTKLHPKVDGSPLQESEILPAKLFSGANVST